MATLQIQWRLINGCAVFPELRWFQNFPCRFTEKGVRRESSFFCAYFSKNVITKKAASSETAFQNQKRILLFCASCSASIRIGATHQCVAHGENVAADLT